MAGHSHWAGIKHKKGKADKQRSKDISKLSKEITDAAKQGDKDPDMNSRLRSAIQAARAANMPKENIGRAIDKSSTNNGENFESMRYEGFGPDKIAVIVEALTDNKNRTASNIRTIFQKHGGGLGTQGSASHNFLQLGVIKIDKEEIDEEKVFNLATDAGANDCIFHENYYEIYTNNDEIYDVKNLLEKDISNFISTEIEWVPINKINLNKEDKEKMIKFLEILEEDDDVQNVFTNAI
jgi:YebC/PmpR family DNA-binding regulatory protein